MDVMGECGEQLTVNATNNIQNIQGFLVVILLVHLYIET